MSSYLLDCLKIAQREHKGEAGSGLGRNVNCAAAVAAAEAMGKCEKSTIRQAGRQATGKASNGTENDVHSLSQCPVQRESGQCNRPRAVC